MRNRFSFRMRSYWVLPLFVVAVLIPSTGFPLDNGQWNTGLNFHFYPPGARALGMGGAFVGLADDATAAASNPAGIAQLTRMQVAVEGRYVNTDSKEDKYFGGFMRTFSDENDTSEISFGAFSTPVFNNMFTVAVFYDKPMSFRVDKNINFVGLQQVPSRTDISIDEVGVSVGKSFADGKLMLGFGMGAQFFDLNSRINSVLNTVEVPTTFAGKADGSDVGISYRAGILAKPIDNLRLGVSYTHMPKFGVDIRFSDDNIPLHSSFNVPDNFAFGAAYNLLPNWTVVAEGKYVMYSQLMKDFVISRSYLGEVSDSSEFHIDSVMEVHFGTEYVLNVIKNVPIALRAGMFFEPAHDLEYTGSNPIEKRLFSGGNDVWHFTAGTGLVLLNHYQIDVGGDFTETSRNVAVSMVYQF